jgi:ribonuclease HII
VVAAAVVLDPAAIPAGLNDSKTLTAAARTRIDLAIRGAAEVGLGVASVEEIDALNILRAAELAMARAVAALPAAPGVALIDGNRVPPGLGCAATSVIGGDRLCLSIAAASIVAKVARDRMMVDLAQQHPGYGWERNKGYPSAEHLAALSRHGASPHHRRSFAPVHNILYQAKTVSR